MSRWRLPEAAVALAYAPRKLVAAAGSPLSLKFARPAGIFRRVLAALPGL